jgi:hypothetical protein
MTSFCRKYLSQPRHLLHKQQFLAGLWWLLWRISDLSLKILEVPEEGKGVSNGQICL